LVSKINNFTNKLLTQVSKWLVRQILVSKIDISLARAPDLTMTLLLLKCVSNLLVKALLTITAIFLGGGGAKL
jgi:hypothetical protein